jgi:hypothetical protein
MSLSRFFLRYDCLSSVAYISNALHYQNQIIETSSICRSDVTLQIGALELDVFDLHGSM